MRCIVVLITLCETAASAQNWALLNPAYKYNYSNDGTDTISNQIKVVRQDVLGTDTVVLTFERTAQLCVSCWSDCDLSTGAPQFLGGSCSVSGSIWTFNEPIARVVRSTAQLGEIWTFEPENGTNANLIAIDVVDVLGTTDSIRTMVSSLGDTVTWSKEFGIIRWNMHDGVPLELIGVNGPDVGVRVPTLWEFFPYQPGDQVETLLSTWTNNWNGSLWRTYVKYVILERIEVSPEHLSFSTTYCSRRENYTGQFVTYDQGLSTWDLDLSDPLLSPILSSPNELVELSGPLTVGYPLIQMVAQHRMDSLGHYVIEAQPGDWGIFTAVEPADTIGCFQVWPIGMTVSGRYRIDSELGIRERYLMTYPDHESFITRGAVLNGDTIGSIHDDPFFHVGMHETAVPHSSLHPTVASESISVTLSPPHSTMWRIISMTGQVLHIGNTGDALRTPISVAELSPGPYVLQLDVQQPIRHRFIVQR